MTQDWIVPAGLGLLALLALTLALVSVALARVRSRTRRELAAARAEAADLRRHLEQIERLLAADRRPRQPEEYTITQLGGPAPEVPAPAAAPATIDRALFADLVLRETVVKVASLTHGLRRALGPESRNRVRFEVRREIKRSRRQRRVDTRQAVREWEARQRAAQDRESDGESAA